MENQDQGQATTTEAIEAVAQQQPAPELSINDLQSLRAIVDLAAKRGAFQAAEMSAIGATFDRVNTFLNAIAPKQPAPEATAPESTEA